MALSPNYGWAEPDNSSLVKNGAQDIRALGNAIDAFLFRPFTRNGVLNSGHNVWQRGISLSIAAAQTNVYTSDRWAVSTTANAASTISRQVNGDTTNLPFIQYCSRIQRNSGQTGVTGQFIYQTFESVNSIPYAGKQVTASFYVRAGATFLSSAATMTAKLWSGTGTDQSLLTGFTGQVQVVAATPTLTATWQRVTMTGTVPATSTQIAIGFDMGAVGTAGATDYLETTGWMVEVGNQASPYAPATPTYATELSACQRYYQRYIGDVAFGEIGGTGIAVSTTVTKLTLPLKVTMRTNPTSIDYAATTLMLKVSTDTSVSGGTWTNNASSANSASFTYTHGSPFFVIGDFVKPLMNNSVGFIAFSAEL